jgi:hypothetical protein
VQSLRDSRGDFVLHSEDVGELAVVALGPKMISVGRVDQLSGHPDAVAGAADAAFENRADSERVCDGGDVLFLSAEGERGGAGRDFQIRDVGQQVQNFLGQSVAEVFVVLGGAHVGEGEYGDGGRICSS